MKAYRRRTHSIPPHYVEVSDSYVFRTHNVMNFCSSVLHGNRNMSDRVTTLGNKLQERVIVVRD